MTNKTVIRLMTSVTDSILFANSL